MANNNHKANSGKLTGEDSKLHSFTIYHRNEEIAAVSLPASAIVADLMIAVRKKLESSNLPSAKFQCLESMNRQEVLDYALLIDSYKIGKLPEN